MQSAWVLWTFSAAKQLIVVRQKDRRPRACVRRLQKTALNYLITGEATRSACVVWVTWVCVVNWRSEYVAGVRCVNSLRALHSLQMPIHGLLKHAFAVKCVPIIQSANGSNGLRLHYVYLRFIFGPGKRVPKSYSVTYFLLLLLSVL